MAGKLGVMEPWAQGVTTQGTSIGTRYDHGDGRYFYYGYAATAVGRGKVAKAAAVIGNHNNMSFQTAPAVGDTSVKVTLGGTAATSEQYKDGWLVVQDGGGEGRAYPIEGHAAQSSTSGTLVVYLKEAIDTTGVLAETNVDLIYNRYDELLPPADTGQGYIPVGVPICVGGCGAAEYAWFQTWGPCSVWQDDTTTLGDQLTWGSGTGTGQVENRDAITESLVGEVGPAVGVATEYQLVYLRINR